MHINTVSYKFAFKAEAPLVPAEDTVKITKDLPSEDQLINLYRTNKWSFQDITEVLPEIISNNYVKLVSYIITREKNNLEYHKVMDKKLIDFIGLATTEEMKILLRLGMRNVNHTEVQAYDAKVIATKQYMTEPAQNKIVKKEASPKPKETKPVKADYFDAFEEVTDNKLVENNVVKKEAEVAKNVINTDGLKDFKLLQLNENEPSKLDDIIGQESVKSELYVNVIAPLKDNEISQKLKENNVDLPNGILFLANDGELAIIKALSGESGMPVVKLENPNELPAITKAVENRFKKSGLRTIILAQGFDKCFPDTSFSNVEANIFKNNIKGIKNKGALFIATTSDKSKINCDFMQSGIIDKVLEIKKPNINDRTEFVKKYFDNKAIFVDLANDDAVEKIASQTDNLTYSDIIRVLNETARTAMTENRKADINIFEDQLKDFSKETGRVPITAENKTAAFDTENFKRIPIEKGEYMSLDELGGMPEVKARLKELYVEPMKHLDELTPIFGADAIPDGAIFYGAPGNGKSLTARVLARELGLPFYETKLSDFGTSLVYESGKRFKEFAQQLDHKFKETGERSVWFLDEFDSVGGARDGAAQHNKELTDTLLQELSNPSKRGYILIAATNNLDDIDFALKRRGRLGNWLEFKNPNQDERIDTIVKNLNKHEFTKDFAKNKTLIFDIAKELDGFSMSSISNILKDAKRDFYLNKIDFETAVKKALDSNLKREMGEFCNKAGLKEHVYGEFDYKSLDELAGMKDTIKQLRENIIAMWDPEIRKILLANKRVPSGGFMLEGPHGTGKTTVIETLAREMNIPLYKMNYNQEGNEYVHMVGKHINEIFDRLALEVKITKKPVMLFFDEAEKFFPRYAERHQIEEVNTYKDIMNTAAAKGIILAGATNHIDLINQEIIGNPRRMGTVIHCGNPCEEDRKDIINKLFSSITYMEKPLEEQELAEIAKLTDGFSIGDLSKTIDRILIQAAKNKQKINAKMIFAEFKPKASLKV